jgi:hypothetical protein
LPKNYTTYLKLLARRPNNSEFIILAATKIKR